VDSSGVVEGARGRRPWRSAQRWMLIQAAESSSGLVDRERGSSKADGTLRRTNAARPFSRGSACRTAGRSWELGNRSELFFALPGIRFCFTGRLLTMISLGHHPGRSMANGVAAQAEGLGQDRREGCAEDGPVPGSCWWKGKRRPSDPPVWAAEAWCGAWRKNEMTGCRAA